VGISGWLWRLAESGQVKTSKADQSERELKRAPLGRKLWLYLKSLGPGLITGASDDDPSGIGTYAQTGAQLGYTQLWMALLTFPLMAVVQEMCARIALVTGDGLAVVLRKYYPKPVLYLGMSLLVVANIINIGADLGAMAAAGQLLLPIPFLPWLMGAAVVTLLLEIFIDYQQYARFLRALTLSLLAYVLVVFVVRQDWVQALRGTFLPIVRFNRGYLLNLVAVLGTTISPYLFFWQASQEVEEEIADGKTTSAARRGASHVALKWMRTDVIVGMLFSNLIMWFIIVTSASTLFRAGTHQIDTAAQAAQALAPLAGQFASLIFAAGIIGTGLLAVPILAGSAAYAVADTFKWPEGLSLRLPQAPAFYGVIALATGVGAGINFFGINPIRALVYTAVINGLAAPPLLVMLMLVANNRRIMGKRVNGGFSNALGWLTTAAMTAAAVAMLFSLVSSN
jgi:NRAMP (natural resistance-associated macrophage protein)-like metal ion transporter